MHCGTDLGPRTPGPEQRPYFGWFSSGVDAVDYSSVAGAGDARGPIEFILTFFMFRHCVARGKSPLGKYGQLGVLKGALSFLTICGSLFSRIQGIQLPERRPGAVLFCGRKGRAPEKKGYLARMDLFIF